MKRRQGPNVMAPRAPACPAESPEHRLQRLQAKRWFRLAFILRRWARVHVPLPWSGWAYVTMDSIVDASLFYDLVQKAVRDRVTELTGEEQRFFAPLGYLTAAVFRRLDLRYVDVQKLAAAMMSIETRVTPAKAYRRVMQRVEQMNKRGIVRARR